MQILLSALPIVAAVIAILFAIIIIANGYVKAPTDEAKIISGMSKEPRVIVGQSAIRIPFLTRVDTLKLAMLSIDVKTSKTIPTLDYINIMVDAVAVVKIPDDPVLIKLAAQNFLNQNSEYITEMIVNVLEGNLREIIGQMNLTQIMNDRKSFAEKVIENAGNDMRRMGLEIISFNIQNIDDNRLGVIENLGIANTVAIQKSAEISRANAEKEIAVARAEAAQSANEAKVKADKDIAEKNNELIIRQSELKQQADQKQADADAAYDIQQKVKQKELSEREVEAQIAKTQKERELKEAEVLVKQQELAATIEKQADAEKYQIEKKAEADKYRIEKEAEAELMRRTRQAEATLLEKQKEAEGISAVGRAEAEAIRAKGLAEAEAMEKKADAYERYGKAAMLDMMTKVLPDMANAIAQPLSAIDNVTIYGGSGSETAGVSQSTPLVMQQVFDTLTNATGVDFSEILRANTYDAKVNRNVNLNGVNSPITLNIGEGVDEVTPDETPDEKKAETDSKNENDLIG